MPFFSSSRRSTRSIRRRRRSSAASAIGQYLQVSPRIGCPSDSQPPRAGEPVWRTFPSGPLVARQACFHPRELLGRRLALEAGLPLVHRHALDQLAGGALVASIAAIANPVGEAVAAEPGEAHEVDVLGIVAVAQVAHE